jgi:hypothetical protein
VPPWRSRVTSSTCFGAPNWRLGTSGICTRANCAWIVQADWCMPTIFTRPANRQSAVWEIRCGALSCPSWARTRSASPQKNGRRCCAGHCPSWARTRTLLIQRRRYNQPNSSNFLLKCEFVSLDAEVWWVSCWNLPYFSRSNVRVCCLVSATCKCDDRLIPNLFGRRGAYCSSFLK